MKRSTRVIWLQGATDAHIHFISSESTFCPAQANWSSFQNQDDKISSLMTEDDIPINCVIVETNSASLSAGYVRWTIHLKNGLAQPREERGLVTAGYFEQFCFSSQVAKIEIFGGKTNGWFGNIIISDLDGQEGFKFLSRLYFESETNILLTKVDQ